jgi:hypothetical protein
MPVGSVVTLPRTSSYRSSVYLQEELGLQSSVVRNLSGRSGHDNGSAATSEGLEVGDCTLPSRRRCASQDRPAAGPGGAARAHAGQGAAGSPPGVPVRCGGAPGVRRGGQPVNCPPAGCSIWPVMNEDSEVARNRHAAATSAGVPSRFIGVMLMAMS